MNELDYSKPQVLPLLYKYKERLVEELEDVEKEVTADYHSGVMDPSRDVAQYERVRNMKKLVGKKLDMLRR